MDELLTTQEAATQSGKSVRWVQTLCRAGRLPSAVKRGRDWWIAPADVPLLAGLPMGRPVTSGAGLRRRRKQG